LAAFKLRLMSSWINDNTLLIYIARNDTLSALEYSKAKTDIGDSCQLTRMTSSKTGYWHYIKLPWTDCYFAINRNFGAFSSQEFTKQVKTEVLECITGP
jgi:hypothetical protein